MEAEAHDVGLKHPFTLLIAGPSRAGKTHFVLKLLKSKLIEPTIKKTIWISSTSAPALPNVNHVESIDSLELENNNNEPTIIILDDIGNEACNDRRVSDLFTKKSHHDGLSVILILQNLYNPGKYTRSITQNAQYLVFFKNPRDQSVLNTLSRQIFPRGGQFLIDAYHHATRTPHGYLFLDFTQCASDSIRVRTNVLENISTVYLR